jgi:isoleucyl-tRNA synthetase
VDEEGRKMSKSLGNTVAPQDIIQQSGAEILRLWVAMVDYREEIRFGPQILARVVEAYRKIRNTMRYLVANLYDFDPAFDRLPHSEMEAVDRFILARYATMAGRIVNAYEEYDYPPIFQALNSFATVDLSAFYGDISKDRLYTFGTRSRERRSAQTAMYVMGDGLTRVLAPVLPVTADELWGYLPGRREESVHLALFPKPADLDALRDDRLVAEWDRLLALRERVLAQIEPLRKDKQIGSSLQAKVVVSGTAEELADLEPWAAELPMLFIVSDVELRRSHGSQTGPSPHIVIERSRGVKCERCWRYVLEVSRDPSWAGLCDRCQAALAEQVHG